jgi:hypothetical protein
LNGDDRTAASGRLRAPLMPRNPTMRRAKTLDIVPRERAMRFFSKPSRIRSVLRLDLSLSPH